MPRNLTASEGEASLVLANFNAQELTEDVPLIRGSCAQLGR